MKPRNIALVVVGLILITIGWINDYRERARKAAPDFVGFDLRTDQLIDPVPFAGFIIVVAGLVLIVRDRNQDQANEPTSTKPETTDEHR